MDKYRLKGIRPPGRVNLPKLGTIRLSDISDELAEELYSNGCPYLEPVNDHSSFPKIEVKKREARRKTQTL